MGWKAVPLLLEELTTSEDPNVWGPALREITGERISVDLNSGRFSKVYGVSHTNPYTTIDGVARTLSLTYRDVTQFVSASSDFSSETLALGVYPAVSLRDQNLDFPWGFVVATTR